VIGVVTTSYQRFPDDSAGGFVRERVRALLRAGHQVEVLAAGGAGDGQGGGAAEATVTRIPAPGLFYAGGAPEALESTRLSARLAAWLQGLCFSGALLGHLTLRRGRWHAVESHWLLPCGLAVCAGLPGLPHRAHVHGGDVYLLARLPGGDSLLRGLCRSRPELVFASASLRAACTAVLGAAPESLGARCLVEAAPFDPSVFCRRPEAERRRFRAELGCERPTLLAAGRLVPIKGFDVLVAAVGQLPPASRPRVIIAGEGPERASLARQARALGVALHLPGLLGQQALARHMVAADLFVHPCRTLPGGRSEGMPLVVREALACGSPVVASASGGIAELLGTPGLTLIEAGSADALVAAIARACAEAAPCPTA
jgi:glycosyltransferase involved in cell wall biosynthesis